MINLKRKKWYKIPTKEDLTKKAFNFELLPTGYGRAYAEYVKLVKKANPICGRYALPLLLSNLQNANENYGPILDETEEILYNIIAAELDAIFIIKKHKLLNKSAVLAAELNDKEIQLLKEMIEDLKQ